MGSRGKVTRNFFKLFKQNDKDRMFGGSAHPKKNGINFMRPEHCQNRPVSFSSL